MDDKGAFFTLSFDDSTITNNVLCKLIDPYRCILNDHSANKDSILIAYYCYYYYLTLY